jgi:hypothetical protein
MNRALLLLGFVTILALGCGSSIPTYDEQTLDAAKQLSKVAEAYKQASQKTRRPVTADDLKPFLKKQGDPDALLTSPLDGKPLVIVPGVTQDTPQAAGERAIIIYEQTGVNGKRMTVDVRGTVGFVTDAEFATIKFVGGHQPAER